MKNLLALSLLACAALPAQQIPASTELPGSPFVIKQTWIVGGIGPWDYLTMDPGTERLYIAHGDAVQVVDVTTGTGAGQIVGLREAHAIALDDTGEFGYISDGPAGQVKVFDRRSFAVVASIPTGPNPRALVLEPQSRLLFAICASPLAVTPPQPSASQAKSSPGATTRSSQQNSNPQPVPNLEIKTSITVIDVQTRQPLGEILMPGNLGFAQSDGNGQVFILIVNRNQVARLDAQAIASLLHRRSDAAAPTQPNPSQPSPAIETAPPIVLDWSHESRPAQSSENSLRFFALGPDCLEARSLAVDGKHLRLFAACNNMKMTVLNGGTGEVVASLPIGPGVEAIGYDPGRGLIYTANGGANGSLTIIHQDVTDTYAEIQNLPTRQRARTLAVNQDTGQVYLVTDLLGVNVAQPGGIGTLKTASVNGSFQVLVIGN